MTRAARAVAVVAGAAAIVLGTACTRVVDDARVVAAPDMGKAAATASDCTSVDAPMTSIPAHTDEEPVMKIPQPDGLAAGDDDGFRSDPVHDALRGRPVQGRDGADGGGDAGKPSWPRRAAGGVRLSEGRAGDRARRHDVQTTETTLCELPAEMIEYTTPPLGILPPHPAKVVTAVLQADDVTWAMTMTVQSADPDNPTYQRDVETILTGFQMLPPSGG